MGSAMVGAIVVIVVSPLQFNWWLLFLIFLPFAQLPPPPPPVEVVPPSLEKGNIHGELSVEPGAKLNNPGQPWVG